MKTTLFLAGVLMQLMAGCAKNDNKNSEPPVDDDLAGPISRPSAGYGADGPYQVAEIDFPNPEYAGTNATIFYPQGVTTARPTIFFSHPYGGEDKKYNRGLFEFIAKKGYAVVFVPYRTIDVSIDHRYLTLWSGFVKAAADHPDIIDTKKVGFMGHSFGGGATITLAYKAFTEKGWGQDGRFLFTMAPWYSFPWGTSLTTEEQLQGFPSNTKMISQVYDDDATNDHRLAIDIFKHINIPAAEKDYVYVKGSTINGYQYVADHVAPSSRSAFDALDYYAVYRLLDAMIDYSFNGNADGKKVALGNGASEQTTMPGYNGQFMAPLEVTDNPAPKYPQSKYQFPCNGSNNLRANYCE